MHVLLIAVSIGLACSAFIVMDTVLAAVFAGYL